MSVNFICRTCDVVKTSRLHCITSPLPENPKITLLQALLKISNINAAFKYQEYFPQKICDRCARKLRNAFDFVTQARQIHEDILECLKPLDSRDYICEQDCLDEAPIDTYTDTNSEINSDLEKIEEPKTEMHQLNDVKYEDSSENDFVAAEVYMDPLFKVEEDEEEETQTSFGKMDESLNENYSDEENLEEDLYLEETNITSEICKPASRKRAPRTKRDKSKPLKCDKCGQVFKTLWGFRTHGLKHESMNDWFACHHCDRKFHLKDSLTRHLKKIDEQEERRIYKKYECNGKEAKQVDINLCRPNGCKVIQCQICLEKFSKIREIREHLEQHKHKISFEKHGSSIIEIRKYLYPRLKYETEDQLKEQIKFDIKEGLHENLYTITNAVGYELSLDTSETDSEADITSKKSTGAQKKTYACDICNERFTRKYKLFDHQRQKHDWLAAKFVCERCKARFVNKKLLDKHCEWMCLNMNKRYLCTKCPMRYRWKPNLQAHRKTHGKDPKEPQHCIECGTTYADQKALTFHMRTVHCDKSKLIPCKWCERTFYRRDFYLLHLKRHGIVEQELPLAESLMEATANPHGTKTITCKLCDLYFESISDLRAHILAESEPAPSMHRGHNVMLNYTIVNESGYELDIDDSETDDETLSGGKKSASKFNYNCELCQLKCERKFEIMKHQWSIHRFEEIPFSCENCVFKTVSKDVLEYHKRTLCMNNNKKHTCCKCGYKFMWPENLDLHMQLQHGLTPGQAGLIEDKPVVHTTTEDGGEAFICPHCDRPYKRQYHLDKHIEEVHIKGDGTMPKRRKMKQPFLCTECGRSCQTNAKLVIHMRMHNGERPFKCDFCNKGFRDRGSMMQHRRIHTGERPHLCTVCGKNFGRYRRLRIHMLTHNGLRPYKCNQCSMTFRYSYDLTLHRRIHENEQAERNGLMCDLCKGYFAEIEELEEHRLICENFD